MDNKRKRLRRFDNDGYMKKKENIIVDMNDIKSMMREFIMYKMEEDMEKVVRNYLNDRIIRDDNNWK